MRAAVVRQSGAAPAFDQFADPQPSPGLAVGTLVAAAFNPLDVALVNGQIPFRRIQPPECTGAPAGHDQRAPAQPIRPPDPGAVSR